MSLLNTPIEVSMRVLAVLERVAPDPLDTPRLVLLDYAIIHSADLGGPESLHPEIPARESELGLRRQRVEESLELLLRVRLAEAVIGPAGISYRAGSRAAAFLNAMDSSYLQSVRARAEWATTTLVALTDEEVGDRLRSVMIQGSVLMTDQQR